MWELDHKKAECWRTDAFKQWCWEKLLRVPWTARQSNQKILQEIIPEYSLKGLMLKLKLQYFGHLMGRIDLSYRSYRKRSWCWERLKARGEGDDKEWDGWMASSTRWMSLSKLQEIVKDGGAWHAAAHRITNSGTWLHEWTTTIVTEVLDLLWFLHPKSPVSFQ